MEQEVKVNAKEIMAKLAKLQTDIDRIKESISRMDLVVEIPETALWSEKSLEKTWLNEEEDEAWKDL